MPVAADLEVDGDAGSSPAEYRVQQGGWLAMLAFVGAALAGLFGAGPLAREVLRDGGLEVTHARFQRVTSADTIEVKVAANGQESRRIEVSRAYLKQFTVEAMSPEPESSTASNDIVAYTFRAPADRALVVTIHVRPSERTFGRMPGEIRADGGGRVVLSQFIWP